MDKELRKDLIRLAYENPKLRGDILPLVIEEDKIASHLREARDLLEHIVRGRDITLVSEGKNIRLYKDRSSIYMVELPQKPLKRRKVRVMALYDWSPKNLPGFDWFLPDNLLKGPKGAKIGKNDTYDQALKKLQGALGEAEQEVIKAWEENPPTSNKKPDPWFPRIDQEEVNYLLVEPADKKPLSVKGKDFSVASNWINFEAYSPDSDFQQAEPYWRKYEAQSPAAARKLYKILHADPNALKSVPWTGFSDWLRKNKIAYKSTGSVWH